MASEHGILFSGPMVRALLAGRKTMTRRAVKPPIAFEWIDNTAPGIAPYLQVDTRTGSGPATPEIINDVCPHPVGTRLYVRETWATERRYDKRAPSKLPKDARVHHMADGPKPEWAGRTRVSMHMPRRYARIFLDVTGVRVERAQAISDADVAAEGVDAEAVRALWAAATQKARTSAGCHHAEEAAYTRPGSGPFTLGFGKLPPKRLWEIAWCLINGRASWDANLWVWVYAIKRTEAGR